MVIAQVSASYLHLLMHSPAVESGCIYIMNELIMMHNLWPELADAVLDKFKSTKRIKSICFLKSDFLSIDSAYRI